RAQPGRPMRSGHRGRVIDGHAQWMSKGLQCGGVELTDASCFIVSHSAKIALQMFFGKEFFVIPTEVFWLEGRLHSVEASDPIGPSRPRSRAGRGVVDDGG